ncbi:unnamed protein product [Heterobilharzia americana]|nr:unnamed protein product [Heterobilharzia americana]
MKSVNNESINSNYIIHSLDYQLFSIDPITGQIYTQGELDREQRSRLEFRVCADDGLHSTCTNVIVDLEDVNDNLPRFERDTYVVRLEENKQYYKPILLFTVSDLDSGNNGFKFNFLNDLNEPQLTIQHLTSSNNTVKQKQRQRKKQIHHDTEIQINKSISQNFENINESGLIQKYFILRENGLYLQHTLDREEHANYHFYVQVHDLQINSSTSNNTHWNHVLTSQAEIFIDVTDVNDNIPIFIFPNITAPTGNRLTVSCHERMGSSIGQIQGYDPDLGLNGTITYTLILTPSDTEQLFHLDNISGELFVNTDQLNNRCGTSIILIISIDDQGPSESKISRHIPMERLIVQLEDKPTISELLVTKDKHQQSDKHWRFGSDDIISNSDVLLRDPGRLGSISKSDSSNTESGMQKIIATSTFSAKTVLSIILGGSTIFLIGLLITSTILLMYNRSKRQKTLINFKQLYLKKDTTDNCNSSNSNCITAEDGLMIGGQQDELTKILFPSNISPDEHIMQTAEYHPTYTMKNSSVNDNNNDEDDDDQGNVTVHSHSCYPHGTNTMMGLHQCAYDPNSINNTEFNDTVNGNYTAYPSTRLPNFIVASQCFGHSSSIMSAQSSSGSSQQQKEQRQLLQRHPSPVCVQRQQVYAKEKLFSNTNANCTVSLAYIIPSWETEQSSVTSQQHQQIPPIPVRLNKKSLYEYKMKQHENDCGKFGQNQQIWENNDKYCNTQNYQHISRTSLEKPPSGRPSSRCLVNNSASKVSHPHNKSSSPVRISKNVNFIPSMPRFHNYPLRKILDNTDYTVNNTCFNSTSQNYELCDHQHLYQFKSNPNILAYTTTIEHTHPNDSSIISQKNQSVNGYSAINNEQNHLLQQYHQPPPPYRFLTPPCTRRFTQFNYHLKSLPINQRNEGYTTLIREKQCSCTTAPVKKPITSPILKKLELLPSIDGKNLDNDNSSNQIERQEPPCCEYMSNYESEICSQCQLINMRNSPTPPFQSIPNLMTTDKMNEHISTTTINVTATGVNGSHSAISTIDNNTLYCINNCPLLNFCNDTTHQQEQYEHSSHHLNYSTMQDMYNSCV